MKLTNEDKSSIKLAAIVILRNECDIVELFIKINAKFFDAFYIYDHHSSDSTPEILKAMQQIGYPIFYKRLADVEFNQAKIITKLAREVANYDIYDYIFPIDGDEFLYCNNNASVNQALVSLLDKNQFGLIPWRTYCPLSSDYLTLEAPLYQNFRMRKYENKQYYKVVLGNEFAKYCSISPGNHYASNKKYHQKNIFLPLELQHVPVRTSQQLIRKTVVGSHVRALRTNRRLGESYHLDAMHTKIRQLNYNINFDALFDISINYATHDSDIQTNELALDSHRIGSIDDTIEYKEFASINLIQSLDFFCEDLVNQINKSPKQYLIRKFFMSINLMKKHLPTDLKSIIRKCLRC